MWKIDPEKVITVSQADLPAAKLTAELAADNSKSAGKSAGNDRRYFES